ncbi:Ferric iron ABC transporter, ATP-binding protein [Nitrincola lacisaponensis]|uniref:Ferric iron ABC transporter, ATP-binding protein n=1 Tax=Nitrincola lacisaponensis TaxID=267850 RepID=A0A063XZE0_9GAMM|nr:putative 2-aminoethylphosphonate ABC transporter ATP-binding protein [Nitrincola lacisaponensis]KDE38844.1 Ferric iron ABC transporter, ATP-binding protein [Nitrincola lacisaponensis]
MQRLQPASVTALVAESASDVMALTSPPQVCLRIESLSKQFGDFTALKSIDLEIYEGEFVCFLGPSGCGKTTLLRAIAGLELQSSGRIIQNQRDISKLPPQKRDFGIVFQSYALFPNLTLADNIAYGLKSQGYNKARIRERVAQLLSLIGLEGSEHKYPAQLSGGQQQRVALARALATEPGLLLLDEPLSALDARVRLHLRQQIKSLQQALGVTTVMVTHDQEEALTMADRIVVMNHGVIEQVGTPEEIYRHPVNAFVASFVGTMNLLPVEIASASGVLLGSQPVACQPHVLQPGAAAHLGIRPEEVVLFDQPSSDAVLEARVVHSEYLGAFMRVTCDLLMQDQQVVVDLQHTDAERMVIAPGREVYLQLPQRYCRIFAEQER